MKNKKRVLSIAAILLLLCMISTAMFSETFARYISEYAGYDTAIVAKWNLEVTDGGDTGYAISPATVAEINLFSHVYNENIIQLMGKKYIIAPGVQGDFVIDITNNSDVAAEVSFDITESDTDGGADIPIEFYIHEEADGFNNDWSVIGDKILNLSGLQTKLNSFENNKKIILEPKEAGTTDKFNTTVYWRWAYEQDPANPTAGDSTDTILGNNSAKGDRTKYTLNIKVTATQVAPAPISEP
ncbi:MAG: hypothetical protein ACOX47_06020 [Bacillota bacterium]|jgi:hypothetical protein